MTINMQKGYPSMIVISSNIKLVEKIDKGLQKNKQIYGEMYCPCSIIRTKNTICPCKTFMEDESIKECHCGKYIRID